MSRQFRTADYEAKLAERQAKAAQTEKAPRGRAPQPPTPGPRAKDQYNFTDPASRIMKESTSGGFAQSSNAQVVTDQASLLVIGAQVSDQPNDVQELLPTLDASPPVVGKPRAAASDAGFFSEPNIAGCAARGSDPYIATGRAAHRCSLAEVLPPQASAAPEEHASLRATLAATLRTPEGRAIYRQRKCTVEPAIGSIKDVLGFRPFSLRGLARVTGEWILVCLAYNIKRLHTLLGRVVPAAAQTAQIAAPMAALVLVLLAALASSLGRLFYRTAPRSSAPCPNLALTASCLRLADFSPTGC